MRTHVKNIRGIGLLNRHSDSDVCSSTSNPYLACRFCLSENCGRICVDSSLYNCRLVLDLLTSKWPPATSPQKQNNILDSRLVYLHLHLYLFLYTHLHCTILDSPVQDFTMESQPKDKHRAAGPNSTATGDGHHVFAMSTWLR